MKYSLLPVLLLVHVSTLLAQSPSIKYLQVDEAKSQLWVVGNFGADSGSVTIEDTTLGIVSWSDTMIVCDLPDRGRGAGGSVQIQTIDGLSNRRVLSIFYLNIDFVVEQLQHEWTMVWGSYLRVNWRDEIDKESVLIKGINNFEASRSSTGFIDGWGILLPWADSGLSKDSSISVQGSIDRKTSTILLKKAYENFGFYDTYVGANSISLSKQLKYDSLGKIVSSSDVSTNSTIRKKTNYYGHIAFPPYSKSFVNADQVGDEAISIKEINDKAIIFKTPQSLGEITASLYSIDGKLMKEITINMNVAGEYAFDRNGINTQSVFLILKGQEVQIAKKIILK